jgi:hypothetical protein
MRQLVNAGDPDIRAVARAALDAFHDRRWAESDAETRSIVEAYGEDPVVGTVVSDGRTIDLAPWHVVVRSSVVVRPDCSLVDKDELLVRGRLPASPSDPA